MQPFPFNDRPLYHILSKTHCISAPEQRKRVACKNVANYIFVFIVKLARITKSGGRAGELAAGGRQRRAGLFSGQTTKRGGGRSLFRVSMQVQFFSPPVGLSCILFPFRAKWLNVKPMCRGLGFGLGVGGWGYGWG